MGFGLETSSREDVLTRLRKSLELFNLELHHVGLSVLLYAMAVCKVDLGSWVIPHQFTFVYEVHFHWSKLPVLISSKKSWEKVDNGFHIKLRFWFQRLTFFTLSWKKWVQGLLLRTNLNGFFILSLFYFHYSWFLCLERLYRPLPYILRKLYLFSPFSMSLLLNLFSYLLLQRFSWIVSYRTLLQRSSFPQEELQRDKPPRFG